MVDRTDIIVDRFRNAACGLADWTECMEMLAAATGSHIGQLAAVDPRGDLAVNIVSGAGPDAIDAYFAANGHDPVTNPRTRVVISAPRNLCLTDDDFVSPHDRATLPIYRGFFRQLDVPYSIQVTLDTATEALAGVVVLRSRSQGPAAQRDVALLTAMAPGIATAVHTGLTLGAAHNRSLAATIETLSGPAILLGRDLRIGGLSAAAEALLSTGLYLTIRQGRLHAGDPGTAQALAAAYRAVTAPAVAARTLRPLALISPVDGTHLLADMCPLPRSTSGPLTQADALLTIRLPRHTDEKQVTALLRRAFALTAAEAAVAVLLADGHSLIDIATRRGCSIGTVRTQLKALFDKTDTRRQADLVVRLRACR